MTFSISQTSLQTSRGQAMPLGNSLQKGGVNYAVYVDSIQELVLHLFHEGKDTPFESVILDPASNRTGNVWHVFIPNPPLPHSYSFEFLRGEERLEHIVDPYAHSLEAPKEWRAHATYRPRGRVEAPSTFDWEGVRAPQHQLEDLIIYEAHLRGFTRDPSSAVEHPGTFLGLIEKIPYLLELGINAVELLPVYEFNENEYLCKNPDTGEELCQYWGYSPLSLYAPMTRYASSESELSPKDQFRTMVRELHRNGIEILLDVVYNHTGEYHSPNLRYSLGALAPKSYYMWDSQGKARDYSGCGNTLNCNHPVTRELIHDSLRYWVCEMGVDGFRFDLASIMTRDQDGTPMEPPPLVEALSADPLLAHSKLIAEPWDAVGLYQVGSFYNHTPRWSEWNGKFRDCARRFLRGNPGHTGEFARRLSGSEDLYDDGRTPAHSVNFITAHDGFSLHDLVSFTHKHNLANGEENRDGSDFNDSWNCGVEGATNDPQILKMRQRQMRNHHLALIISLGVPMVRMGDEYGHSQFGNNNTWCQDNAFSWQQWQKIAEEADFFRFFSSLLKFRQRTPQLKRSEFLKADDIQWHGEEPCAPNWEADNHLVAFSLCDATDAHSLYCAFNSQSNSCSVRLPKAPESKSWHRIVDTALEAPLDFMDETEALHVQEESYLLEAFSAILLRAQ